MISETFPDVPFLQIFRFDSTPIRVQQNRQKWTLFRSPQKSNMTAAFMNINTNVKNSTILFFQNVVQL